MKMLANALLMVLFFIVGLYMGIQKERDRKNQMYYNVHDVLNDAVIKGRDSVSVKAVWDTLFVKSEF